MTMLFALIATIASVSAALSGARVQMEPTVNKFSSKFWKHEGVATDSDRVEAIFVIKKDAAKLAAFEAQLYDLSTPSSANYGKWKTKEEIAAQIAPSAEHLKKVTDFLAAHNVDQFRVSDFGDKVFVNLPASTAASMLNTEFARFRSLDDDKVVLLRVTQPYSLPEEIAEVVSLVDDIIRFPSVRRSNLHESINTNLRAAGTSPFDSCGSKCSGFTTPSVLQQAYSFSLLTKANAKSSVAVAEFQNQYYDDPDLKAFSSACGVTSTVTTVIGGNNPKVCNVGCVEALLDIEYIGAITYPIPLTTIYSSTYSILNYADGLNSMKSPPWVNSVSYGNDEAQQTSTEYMQECNTAFQTSGTLGLSVLFAAGDQGVWGREGVGATFNPDFPAGSPYVTAVGGTNFAQKSVIGAETTWNCGGGGFSDTFTIPSFQSAQVANYLALAKSQNVLPASNLFNAQGRGYPDIAALGGQTNPYCVAVGGGTKFEGVAGTSASCPVAAGIIAQLNDVRFTAGKSSLGWLNPFLYATNTAACFQDVNDGSLNNCYANSTGFAALNGWDPATGLGTLNYECLATLV